ncbi:MAG: LysM peptidoglycan-binding domain-containing protein [Bacteroidia bacterium]|nr:LysM peptidoglycan-binding domain-containing protein [Bacteroidia bacterium]
MHRKFLITGIIALIFAAGGHLKASTVPADSIGLKVVNGKTYIMHQVDKGESLYAISRRYKVSVAILREENDLKQDGLNLGQIILVPTKSKVTSMSLKEYAQKNTDPSVPLPEQVVKKEKVQSPPAKVAKVEEKQEGGTAKFHLVVKGQTLFAISRIYNVSVENIRKWNNLTSNELNVGQMLRVSEYSGSESKVAEKTTEPVKKEAVVENATPIQTETENADRKTTIHVVAPGETLWAVSKKYNMALKDLRTLNKLNDTDIKEGQKLKVLVEGSPVAGEKTLAANPTAGNKVTPPVAKKEELPPLDEKIDQDGQNDDLAQYKVVIPPEAEATKIRIKGFGKAYWKVKEKGEAGAFSGTPGENRKFYATHKTLPPGTIMQVESTKSGQKVTVEVLRRSDPDDTYLIRLSEKARLYLLLENDAQAVQLSYTLPAEEK